MARFKEETSTKDILKVLNFYLRYNKHDVKVEELRDLVLTGNKSNLVLNDYESAIVSKALRFCLTRDEFRLSKTAIKRLELELAVEPAFYYELFGIEKLKSLRNSSGLSNKSLGCTTLDDVLKGTIPYGRSFNSIN